ncbi:MAG: hypothetical protein ACOY71_09565 [Gemmatimonadota bacterium]
MPIAAAQVRAAVERAGEEHWRALVAHHEGAYPRPAPTPGAVCYHEAQRLNALGLGDDPAVELLETRVTRKGDEIELVHVFARGPERSTFQTEPYRNYAPDA